MIDSERAANLRAFQEHRDRRRDICESACAGIKNPSGIGRLVKAVRSKLTAAPGPDNIAATDELCNALVALDMTLESEVRK